MITVVEPYKNLRLLWSSPEKKHGLFRMMQYVMRVVHEDRVLLHNVVTGHLVVLEDFEVDIINSLPKEYSSTFEQLVEDHFLVPDEFDEHRQVVQMRKVLRLISADNTASPKEILNYTILPTSACNARCYYCFEQGVSSVTMTEQTANDTVKFILGHCGDKKSISIRWFGGEPTLAVHRIDQICEGLRDNGIVCSSSMTTNGYLFDEEMVIKARKLWNLKNVMISVDGVESNYNDIKAYISAKDNPYQRVLKNIGLLLDQKVIVSLRMNFDLGNYKDFYELLTEAYRRYRGNKYLQVYAFPVLGIHPNRNGLTLHGDDKWFDDKLVELNDAARANGLFYRSEELPSLFYTKCLAGDPSFMVISADGNLARCSRVFFDADQVIGNVRDGIIDHDIYRSWSKFADPERCVGCVFFPKCVLMENCPGLGRCFFSDTYRQHELDIIKVFINWKIKCQYERGVHYDSRRTQSGICKH